MKRSLPISEEMLNAYVDGEIDGDELERIIEMEATDKELAVAICETRKLKNLVKAARAPEPEATSAYLLKKSKKGRLLSYRSKYFKASYLAASVLLVLVTVAYGYFNMNDVQERIYLESASLDENNFLVAVSEQQNLNLVMHLKSENVHRADKLLSLLEAALIESRKNKNNLHVEVIVSGPGLHLLQKESLTSGNKIHILKQEYQNLTFLACGKTLHRLEDKSGKEIQMVEEAMLVASGPEWIKKRKASGWAYILI